MSRHATTSSGWTVARHRRPGTGLVLWVALLAALCPVLATPAAADDAGFAQRVRADTRWLSGYGTRQIGTADHARAQDDLLAKVRAIPGVEVWTDEFPVVVPTNTQTHITVPGQGDWAGRHDMLPLWPDVARLNTTPIGGIDGKLIYVGDASHKRIPAVGLRGNIAVMEMSAYEDYRRVFDYGAEAVILLESDKPGTALNTQQSLYKPRYYVKAGPLAEALRAGAIERGTIVSKGEWTTVTARNIYAGVKPTGAEPSEPYAVVAPYDSMSHVLGVAPGADVAIDAAIVLNRLRDAAENARRPLLFGFVDAYHINQLGMRRMAAMLNVTPGGRTRTSHRYIENEDLQEYEAAMAELERFSTIDEGLANIHDRSSAERIRRMFKDGIGRDLLKLRTIRGELRLIEARDPEQITTAERQQAINALQEATTWILRHHKPEMADGEVEALEEARTFALKQAELSAQWDYGVKGWAGLDQAQAHATRLLAIALKPLRSRNTVINAAFSADRDVPEELRDVAHQAWKVMAERTRGRLKEQQQRIAFFEPLDELRARMADYFELNRDGTDKGICPFVLGIDISDCGVIVGPGMHCGYNRIEMNNRDFLRAIKGASKDNEIWPEGSGLRRFVNISQIEGRIGSSNSTSNRALITSAAASFQLPGVTWITDDASRKRVNSPLDRYDRIDWERVTNQLAPTQRFMDWLFASEQFDPRVEPVEDKTAQWRHGMGRVVDVSAGETIPRVPRRGFLVTLTGSSGSVDGILRNEFAYTGHDGSFRIPLLCAEVYRYEKERNLQAFRINFLGQLVEALTTTESMVSARLTTSFNLGAAVGDQLPRAVTFECTEFNGPSFFDARFLEPLTEAKLLDAIRGASPKQSHFSIDQNGQVWGLVERGMRWQLVVRAGASGVRVALLNSIPDARGEMPMRDAFGRGYPINATLDSIPVELSARDFYRLNGWRVKDFQAAGINSDKINEIRDETAASLEEADRAKQIDSGALLHRSGVRALASEIRAYRAVTNTGQDIARGAIFLMLILVPFSIAMERLLFAFTRIGYQITAGIAIFAFMTLVLWSFHPAFRISAQPLVIVMAFVILAMSLAVISMVLSRFRAAMREFQSSLAEGSGAQMGRSGLLGSAVFLGIANMRKRKVRTALTGATLVLVTFALLCFSSTSSYVDKKDFRLDGVTAKKSAVMIRRTSFGPIDWKAREEIQTLLGGMPVTAQARAWMVPDRGDTSWRMWALNPQDGEQVSVGGALGLPPNEDQLTAIDAVLPNWDRFAAEGGCYIAEEKAQQLGVEPGDTVVVRGYSLTLRGTFDPISLEDEVDLLDGQRILPYDYAAMEQDWVNRDSQDAIEQETESATAMQPTGNEEELFLTAREVIILPTDLVQEMGGELRSVAIACGSTQEAADVAHTLMRTIVYPAYYSNDEGGVNVVVSTPLIAVPPRSLAVPLVIAALIIFTTMLNSVSERKKEIYVYSSLGLAPMHIGALFVAEALTYGLMGSVFGYIAGQGVATALTGTGLMEGITLNYSGTAVIKTMVLVQVVVVLAAVVPAIMAGRIASPSKEMAWRVPDPVDGKIYSTLPFTVSPAAAPGLVAFIYEYLQAHRDGVLGKFDVDDVKVVPETGDENVAALEARIWLAPFDMGVRQKMHLTIKPPDDGVCEIGVVIEHETGTPKLWWRLNKPYFYELRRQLLGWRKVTPERMQEYADRLEGITSGAQA